MTHMTLDRPETGRLDRLQSFQLQSAESPLPSKSEIENSCPYCHHSLNNNPTTFQRLRSGFRQLIGAAFVIVMSIFRLARLIVAFVLGFVGVIGFGFQNISQRIVHPDDRKLLPRRNRRTAS